MVDPFKIAQLLSSNGVNFVIVGGIAIRGHGGNYITEDLDICYARDRENLKRIAQSLAPLNPKLRGHPSDLPFVFDWTTLEHGTNFTFTTDLGDLDLLGEVKGVGTYADLVDKSIVIDLDGFETRILSIPGLIAAKTAAARDKDAAGLKVLYALQEAQSDAE